jgi:hypothetical protein
VGFAQIVFWADAEEARAADAALYGGPCGPGCASVHMLVWCAPGRVHVAPSVHHRPPPAAAAEIAAQYARYKRRQ